MKNLREWTWLQDKKTFHPIFDEQVRQQAQTHAGLWLDKYVREEQPRPGENKLQPRPLLVAEVAKLPISESYPYFYEQWEKALQDYQAHTHLARTKGRMIVNLGASSIIETSIAIHHTYGTPYIPGSSLKGLAAGYLRHKQRILAQENSEESQIYKELAAAYNILFGDQNEAGYITFFDAHYHPGSAIHQGQEQPLHSDIMTVHHPKYYQGQQAPDDKQSPIPIPFLSATGHYLIALAAPDLDHNTAWIDFTFDLLAQALLDWGIGAKTSSGYGRMTIDDVQSAPVTGHIIEAPKPAPIDPIVQKIEGYIKEVTALPNNASINGQLNSHYKRWLEVKNHAGGSSLALAIAKKIRNAGCEKNCRTKSWYQEMVATIEWS